MEKIYLIFFGQINSLFFKVLIIMYIKKVLYFYDKLIKEVVEEKNDNDEVICYEVNSKIF